MNSRDLCNVIIISVASFLYAFFVRQTAYLLTGILGITYILSIGHSILYSLALLLYDGKRWLILMQGSLITLLVVPTLSVGGSVSLLSSLPLMINALQGDLLSNSVYGFFNRRNQLKLWTIIMTTEFFLMSPFLNIITFYLFFSPEVVTSYITIIQIMLPIIILESAGGAFIGYQVFERVKTTRLINK